PDLHPPDTLDGQRILGRDKTLAVFAHGNYNINENVSLFGGLRLTRDEKTVDYAIFGETFALFGLSPLQHHQKLTYTPLSWSIGARTRATDNLSAYVKISHGYRSATIKDDFIGQADLAAPTGFFTKPEFLTNYELGFKFHRPKSGLRLDASAFYMDYQDIQVSISQEPFLFLRTLTNAAKAHIVGFEADMDWQFAPNWRVSGGAGYIKTRYDRFEPEPGRDLSGTGFGTAPKWTFNGALDYEHADRHGRWQAHIDGHYLIAPDDFVLRTLPFVGQYPVFNGWIGFAPKNRAWQIRLWVKNLGNTHRPKTNFHWGAGLGPLLDNITVQYEPPRRYGLSLSVPFGR
ncbi:MAG TPA: TonB-dependent receptor, partial [Hellea balneolensis]|nr:TonB-dependent receptor [Hellea balneolensis]